MRAVRLFPLAARRPACALRRLAAASRSICSVGSLAVLLSCSAGDDTRAPEGAETTSRPAVLLVTLDTTRADAMGFETDAVETPSLEGLAARGLRFSHAYATAPMTLPAHTSMLTGLLPRDHGIHENSRVFARPDELLAPKLRAAGYRTAAFVSGLPLERQFGLGEGFDTYDDALGAANERSATETTDRAVAYLERQPASEQPTFLWVHYFDPHDPYTPPEPFRARYSDDPYLGEVAYMDSQLGRLLEAFERRAGAGAWRVLVAGDHGEGRGEHGEALHGNLLYQGTMRVPLVIAGTGVPAGMVVETPVSTRRVHDSILLWAGASDVASDGGHAAGAARDLLDRAAPAEVVYAEAMKPFLEYGWRPQVMAVTGGLKAIWSGELELYDLAGDPEETRNLAEETELDPELRRELESYPAPVPLGGASPGRVDDETRARLSALGYTSGEVAAPRRENAPSPKDMTGLFADLDLGSGLFQRHQYAEAIPVFERLAAADPENLTVHLRLAVARSVLGEDARAVASFERARAIAPEHLDVRHYLGLHYLKLGRFQEAEKQLDIVLAATPNRVPAIEAMAEIRARQGKVVDALALADRAIELSAAPTSRTLELQGRLRMARGDTSGALESFERARGERGGSSRAESFGYDLELGVLYLAEHRYAEARAALDRVPPQHPSYAMALFKRAQVSVLLGEADRERRVREAWRRADAELRALIRSERLFAGIALD